MFTVVVMHCLARVLRVFVFDNGLALLELFIVGLVITLDLPRSSHKMPHLTNGPIIENISYQINWGMDSLHVDLHC